MIKNKINKDTTLEKVLSYPDADKILIKYKVPCLGCPFASMEQGYLKLGDICKNYGIDVKKLISDLNSLLKEQKL